MDNNWRSLWEKAVIANSEMIANREAGIKLFEELLSQKEDGMLLYEFGMAYAVIGEKELALTYLEKAQSKFPLAEWKTIAEVSRLKINNPNYGINNKAAKAYYEINMNKTLAAKENQSLRYLALYSVGKVFHDRDVAIIMARSSLEKIVAGVLYKNESIPERFNLSDAINELKNSIGRPEISEAMHRLRKAGNAAVHAGSDRESKLLLEDKENRIDEFRQIINYFFPKN